MTDCQITVLRFRHGPCQWAKAEASENHEHIGAALSRKDIDDNDFDFPVPSQQKVCKT